ncbi:lipase [Penicillium manginii]|uniref:lipase n=1 Tax=Penicillium manginii TaxID=203109 RepID=UPI00254895AF|nr:lipase [Penicillium manginii]KAJ5743992.1 lipase [Penicillium manginii]
MNYISTQTNLPVAILTCPDFYGNVIRILVYPVLSSLACTPALYQQDQNTSSISIRTLRANDGDSADVSQRPSTRPSTRSSSYSPAPLCRHCAATRVASASASQPHIFRAFVRVRSLAGSTHEGCCIILAWALALDAIAHGGPASLDRIDREQNLVVVAAAAAAAHLLNKPPPHTTAEPPMGYASS